MPRFRHVETYEQGTGRLLDSQDVPYTAVEEAEVTDRETIESNLLSIGRAALTNWGTLTAAQKDAVLRGLLRYVLHNERR